MADDDIAEQLVKAVYLKTGHVFDDERQEAVSRGFLCSSPRICSA